MHQSVHLSPVPPLQGASGVSPAPRNSATVTSVFLRKNGETTTSRTVVPSSCVSTLEACGLPIQYAPPGTQTSSARGVPLHATRFAELQVPTIEAVGRPGLVATGASRLPTGLATWSVRRRTVSLSITPVVTVGSAAVTSTVVAGSGSPALEANAAW